MFSIGYDGISIKKYNTQEEAERAAQGSSESGEIFEVTDGNGNLLSVWCNGQGYFPGVATWQQKPEGEE